MAKRSKRQRGATIAANLHEGNVGIQISSGDSTSPQQVSPNKGMDEAPQVQKKKTRGPSRLEVSDKSIPQRI